MKTFSKILIGLLVTIGLVHAQTGVRIVSSGGNAVIIAASGNKGVAYDSTLMTVPDSATVLTADKTWVQVVTCANITGSAATFTLTDGNNKAYADAVSLPADSMTVIHFGGFAMPFAGGVKWATGTTNALNCQIVGVQ